MTTGPRRFRRERNNRSAGLTKTLAAITKFGTLKESEMANVAIDGAVGLKNRKTQVTNYLRDQAKITQLLSAIPALQGGKKEQWAAIAPLPGADSKCSQQLGDAIWDFQSFWNAKGELKIVDGVVDPGKSALRKMNELAPAFGTGPTPPTAPTTTAPTVLQRAQALLPRALARQQSALAMLGWASVAIDFPDTNDFNKGALELVNRCFKIYQADNWFESSRRNQWKADIATVTRVYVNGIAFLMDPNAKNYFIEASDAAVTAACNKKANAYTNPGHWTNKNPADGIWINKDIAVNKSDDWLLDAMTHELAHFCGPSPNDHVDDHAYGNAALALPRTQALKCAANHAWFAGLSQMPPHVWPNGTYPS